MDFKVFVFSTLLVISALSVKGVKVEGNEPAYRGRLIRFYTLTDPVTKNEKPLFTFTPDSRGFFETEVKVDEITWCFSDIGIYRLMLFITPGVNIRIKLPVLREKSFEESKNPYFEPVQAWVVTENGPADELTNLVARFDKKYYQLIDKYFNQLYYRQLNNYIDTIKKESERDFSAFKSQGFLLHKQLRMKLLEAGIMHGGREKTAGSLKEVRPGFWNHPSFSEFINNLFVNTLGTESKSISGPKIKQWIYRENLPELVKWTETLTGTKPPLTDLILLKMLHDAWYSGEFSKTAVQHLAGSDFFKNNKEPEIRAIAREVELKFNFLRVGSMAPEICLPLTTSGKFCSSSNTKPFLYILFTDPEIPVCQEHLKYLKTMAEKTGQGLQILIVSKESKKIGLAGFISANQIPGIVVTDSGDETARLYKIRSYPSAFLLDRNHKVVLAPAKTPLDGFEFQFAGIRTKP